MAVTRYKLAGGIIAFVAAILALRAAVGPHSILGAILVVVALIGMLAFTLADWRLMDEASRDAHKTAAFWGVAVGFTLWALAFTVLIFFSGPHYAMTIWGHPASLATLALGGLSAMVAQLLCYLGGVAVWWLAKR